MSEDVACEKVRAPMRIVKARFNYRSVVVLFSCVMQGKAERNNHNTRRRDGGRGGLQGATYESDNTRNVVPRG
jgi:hypothetical protein